jgi:hypothetical protein
MRDFEPLDYYVVLNGEACAMVANVLAEGVKFVALFAAVLAVMFLFPFLMMVFFRRFFLGNPDGKLNTIRKVKN